MRQLRRFILLATVAYILVPRLLYLTLGKVVSLRYGLILSALAASCAFFLVILLLPGKNKASRRK